MEAGRSSALNWNVLPSARTATAPKGGVPEGEVTYHKDIALPKEFEKPKAGLVLRYGSHSIERAQQKGIELPKRLPDTYNIIEVTMQKYRVVKWVLRFPADAYDDVVMAVLPDGFVKTAWINARSDKHNTLDRSKYALPAF